MGIEQIIYITSRLLFGAAAAFIAIILWSKTRDISWMLMTAGIIAIYAETIYTILGIFGLVEGSVAIGSLSITAIILVNLPILFFIAAFTVMVVRQTRIR